MIIEYALWKAAYSVDVLVTVVVPDVSPMQEQKALRRRRDCPFNADGAAARFSKAAGSSACSLESTVTTSVSSLSVVVYGFS